MSLMVAVPHVTTSGTPWGVRRRRGRRGVSAGERKRLSTAEMLVGNSRFMAMDEINTGLVRTRAALEELGGGGEGLNC